MSSHRMSKWHWAVYSFPEFIVTKGCSTFLSFLSTAQARAFHSGLVPVSSPVKLWMAADGDDVERELPKTFDPVVAEFVLVYRNIKSFSWKSTKTSVLLVSRIWLFVCFNETSVQSVLVNDKSFLTFKLRRDKSPFDVQYSPVATSLVKGIVLACREKWHHCRRGQYCDMSASLPGTWTGTETPGEIRPGKRTTKM